MEFIQKESLRIKTALQDEDNQLTEKELNDFLFSAIDLQDIELVKLALTRGADINAKDYVGQSPLMCAASCSQVEVIEFLMDSGADINYVYNLDNTALLYAFSENRPKIVELLLSYNQINLSEDNVLIKICDTALANDIFECLKVLVDYNPDFIIPILKKSQYTEKLEKFKEFYNQSHQKSAYNAVPFEQDIDDVTDDVTGNHSDQPDSDPNLELGGEC